MKRKEEWKLLAGLMMIVLLGMALIMVFALLVRAQYRMKTMTLAQAAVIESQAGYIEHLERVRGELTAALETKWQKKVTVTAYHETNLTASGTRPRAGGTVAVSRDLFNQGWTFDKKIYIPEMGIFTITDLMHEKWTERIDLFKGTVREAREFGVKTVKASLVAG